MKGFSMSTFSRWLISSLFVICVCVVVPITRGTTATTTTATSTTSTCHTTMGSSKEDNKISRFHAHKSCYTKTPSRGLYRSLFSSGRYRDGNRFSWFNPVHHRTLSHPSNTALFETFETASSSSNTQYFETQFHHEISNQKHVHSPTGPLSKQQQRWRCIGDSCEFLSPPDNNKTPNAVIKHNKSDKNTSFSLLGLRGGSSALASTTLSKSMSLTSQKILLQIALTAFNILCWTVPLRNAVFYQSPRALSIANSFAGGVFLMLSFGHLIPQALTIMSEHGYQAICYVLAGFLAMLFVERIAFCESSGGDSADTDYYNTAFPRPERFPLSDRTNLVGDEEDDIDALLSPLGKESFDKYQGSDHGLSKFRLNSAMILCIAMSVHSFFESSALALANNAASVYLMSACIALHQPAESLALAVAFLKTNMGHWDMVTWLLVFSFTSCIGLIAGMLIKSIASEQIEGIVVALTAGTFVYVGTNEIVNEEFPADGNKRHKLVNFIMYVFGMFTMAWLSNIAEQWEQH